MAIQISSTTVIDNSRNLSNIANASVCACPSTYALTDASNNIYAGNFNLTLSLTTCLGLFVQGGYLICKSSSVGWIASQIESRVVRSWANIADANTRAQAVSGCTGWFVPTCAQLQNPGYTCRTFWESTNEGSTFWSSTQFNSTHAFNVAMSNNSAVITTLASDNYVSSFRCVAY